MFPVLYFAAILGQFTQSPKPPTLDQATVVEAAGQGELSWGDAEDKVTGSFSPFSPREGGELDVVARVGNLQGPEFAGPVTLTLKPVGQPQSDSKTVTPDPKAKAWAARLQVGGPGEYVLEIAYTTTRHKVVRAAVKVGEAPLSRWPWYALVAAAAGVALTLGVRAVLKRKPGA